MSEVQSDLTKTFKSFADWCLHKEHLSEATQKAYEDGIDLAARETSLTDKDFPAECSYSIEQVIGCYFFPRRTNYIR